MSKSKAIIAAAVAGGVIAAGGVAYATIPSADGTIYGCYHDKGGTLRVIDDTVSQCRSTETAISWNQIGPQGPQGLKGEDGKDGADGAKGDQGSAGTSQAFTVTGELINVSRGGRGVVASKSVPAGSYVLSASVSALANGSNDEVPFLFCRLNSSTSVLAFASETPGNHSAPPAFSGDSSLSLTATFEPTGTATVVLECGQLRADDASFYGNLTVINVDSIS